MGSLPSPPFQKVLIAGAGPAGLLLALLLSQHGIPSTVLESWDHLDERLRATQYGVPATRIFRRAGILDDIRAVSIASFPSICWRRVSDHQRLTGIDLSVVKDHPDRMTILPLNQIIQIVGFPFLPFFDRTVPVWHQSRFLTLVSITLAVFFLVLSGIG